MPLKEEKAAPRAMAPAPSQTNTGLTTHDGGPFTTNQELLYRRDKKLHRMGEDGGHMDTYSISLDQDARQSRFTMEADEPIDTNTCERKEGAANAVQAIHGDNCSAYRVDLDPMCFRSFGNDYTDPPAPPCSGETVLVDNGAAALMSCVPSLEMRSPTKAHQQPPRLFPTEINSEKMFAQYVPYDKVVSAPTIYGNVVNREKPGRSIQVILKVVSAPIRYGNVVNQEKAGRSIKAVLKVSSRQPDIGTWRFRRNQDVRSRRFSRLSPRQPDLRMCRAMVCGEIMRVGPAG